MRRVHHWRPVTPLADIMHGHPGIETTEIVKRARIKPIVREVTAEKRFLPREFPLPIAYVDSGNIAREVGAI